MIDLKTFYDEHPINETEILDKLAADGIPESAVGPEHLSRYDQDHYGGLAATDALVDILGIEADMRVLDICSGMGGTSRYLAYRYGASVVGIDLNESRVAGARRLTGLVDLDHMVTFQVGDAADLDFPEASFDRAICQEAFLHVADKEAAIGGCHRVLKSGGGFGFTDWIATDRLDERARSIFAETFAAPRSIGLAEYGALLEAAGFVHVQARDLSAEWKGILTERLEMFRSLEKETVSRFGQDRFDTYIRNYEFFVQQIDAGALGGGRFGAWKP
ncbi:class I SAM-dependent methyltransferase [Microbaculum marinum]|uniref:Methyltransferase domain-containing protein n=1 Tax=Microbaculum marinum TaxID=1764581 RepID=A0AAW9RZE8_9HYPH